MEIDNDTPTAALLEVIGWSPAVFADKLGVNPRTAQRWASGQNETPGNIHQWLRDLAWTHKLADLPFGWVHQCQE